MSQLFYDNLLTVGYLLAWVCLFGMVHWRYRHLDAYSLIVGTYIMYAVFSVGSLNDEYFNWMYKPLTLFPYVFLFLMLNIALAPALRFHMRPAREIQPSNSRVVDVMLWVIVLCSVMLLPMIAENFNEGLVRLLTDSDAGKEMYGESMSNASDSGKGVSNIPAIIFNACYDVAVFFFFYYLSLRRRPVWLLAGLGFSLIVGWLMPIMAGNRGGIVTGLLTVVMAYFLFRRYLSRALTRVIEIGGFVTIMLASVPIVAMTASRFGETNAGIVGYVNWYVGQANLYFNNSAMDAGGIRNGDRTLNLFKRVIDPSTPANYNERRDKYRNLEIDDYYFTTFVGDFCLDFGPVLAFFIFVAFNACILYGTRPRDGTVRLDQMLMLYFTMCVCVQGGMTLFLYSDSGNLRIIVLFAIVFYLQLHDALLRRFPKQSEESTTITQ